MTYVRYWDMPEQDRAKLKEDEFTRLLAVEFMEQGATPPAPLNLIPEPASHPLPTTTYYQVGPVVFADMRCAEEFLDLSPCTSEYDWKVGYEDRFAKPIDRSISTVEMCDKQELELSAATLTTLKKTKDANEKETARWNKENEAYESVGSAMRQDWYRCLNEASKLRQVIDTYEQYVVTANGDHSVASKFIVKAYPTPDVRKAFEWAGTNWADDPDLPRVSNEVPA